MAEQFFEQRAGTEAYRGRFATSSGSAGIPKSSRGAALGCWRDRLCRQPCFALLENNVVGVGGQVKVVELVNA